MEQPALCFEGESEFMHMLYDVPGSDDVKCFVVKLFEVVENGKTGEVFRDGSGLGGGFESCSNETVLLQMLNEEAGTTTKIKYSFLITM